MSERVTRSLGNSKALMSSKSMLSNYSSNSEEVSVSSGNFFNYRYFSIVSNRSIILGLLLRIDLSSGYLKVRE